MDIALLIIGILVLILLAAVLIRQNGSNEELRRELRENRSEMSSNIQNIIKGFSDSMHESQKETREMQDTRLRELALLLKNNQDELKGSVDKKLGEIRTVVDEKLQETLEKRIGESFKLVSERLEQVYKGLGEMQSIAAGVGDLKKVLTNVKTRGILGEVQLHAILNEILTPTQFVENYSPKGRDVFVEFAVKLPGQNGDGLYLPIDSKFPTEAYQRLNDAYESGDKAQIELETKNLSSAIKKAAKDIRDKYIVPPETTDFAILFLPFEGLYAEAVRLGMIEVLQHDYKVTLAGPTTMAAILNAFRMGFKTLAIQKRAGEVWDVLGAVRTEFDKFSDAFEKFKKKMSGANEELEGLVGTRTRMIMSKLNRIEKLPEEKAEQLLEE